MKKISHFIDILNRWIGRIVGFAVIIIMFVQVFDVVMRDIFNRPTIWAWDINAQLFIISAMLAGGYTLLGDNHVRLDLMYGRLSKRNKAILDLVASPFILVAFCILTWQLVVMAIESWVVKEHAFSTFSPPLYPLKTIICIAVVLLLLQTISMVLKRIRFLQGKNDVEKGVQ